MDGPVLHSSYGYKGSAKGMRTEAGVGEDLADLGDLQKLTLGSFKETVSSGV